VPLEEPVEGVEHGIAAVAAGIRRRQVHQELTSLPRAGEWKLA